MSLLQLAGSFLAIPVALGSAYTVYQTNFSAETQCQMLRSSIIAMIDKKIDAPTRRMLVRRDVETFEKSCGAFDPDAKAAFVMLLQEESRTVPPRPVAQPKGEVAKAPPVKSESPKAEIAKVEPAKSEAPKVDVRSAEKAEAPKVEAPKVGANNDARWLEAVRGALVSTETARETATAIAARALSDTPVQRSAVVPATVTPVVAPVLPAPTTVGPQNEPRQASADADRPVPPAAIPDAPPLDIAKTANGGRTWVSDIPFVGQILDK